MKILRSLLVCVFFLLIPAQAHADTPVIWRALDDPPVVAANDPYLPQQWDLQQVHAPLAWNYTMGSSDVLVAIIDSGIDTSSGEFAGRVLPTINLVASEGPEDNLGHGTHVAGIIAAAANDVGTVGVAPRVRILPIKVLNEDAQTSSTLVARAIDLARQNGASIINISLGGTANDSSVLAAIIRAVKADIIIICAAGNSGNMGNPPIYPAAYTGVMAVSASDEADSVPAWSSTGPYISVSAPGVSIMSLTAFSATRTSYMSMSGTSMAAPHVTAIAALVRSINRGMDIAQVMEVIESTANRELPEYNQRSGWGRADAFGAVKKAQEMSGTPSPAHFIFLPGLQR